MNQICSHYNPKYEIQPLKTRAERALDARSILYLQETIWMLHPECKIILSNKDEHDILFFLDILRSVHRDIFL